MRVHGLTRIFQGLDDLFRFKRISEPLNPRVCRVVALGTPTERERGKVPGLQALKMTRSTSR